MTDPGWVPTSSLKIQSRVGQIITATANEANLAALKAAFDGITGGGRDPGCVIVKSAGNERSHAGHAKVQGFQGGTADIRWTSSARFRSQDYFETWFNFLDDFAFHVTDPAGRISPLVSFTDPEVNADLGGNALRMELTQLHPDNGDHRLTVTIAAAPNMIQPGEWRLDIVGNRVHSQTGKVHIWVERAIARAIRFATQDPQMTLSIPGTARTVICVGAGTAEQPYRLTDSSSRGPTRTHQLKPELCAPGFEIRSAASFAADLSATTVKTGTWMAAPHVTGALAVVLSHRQKAGGPLPNAVQLRAALINAIPGTAGRHNVGAGYGMLDTGKLYDDLK